MKYIRTEDGKIFDTQYEPKAFKWGWNVKFIIDDNNLIVYDKRLKDRIANHGQILKQADTIEELCDEFVVWTDKKDILYKGYDFNLTKSFIGLYENLTIYGAIWTEWGLKYVAKMNDKGELELL